MPKNFTISPVLAKEVPAPRMWGVKRSRSIGAPRFVRTSKGPVRFGAIAHLNLTSVDFGVRPENSVPKED